MVLALSLLTLPAFAADPPPARQVRLKEMVAEDCGACHGMTRKGGLGPPLLQQSVARFDDRTLAATILDGRPGTPMPPWRGLLSADDAAWIARYLKGETDVR